MNFINNKLETIHLASPQGFCAGVASAIEIVDLALEKYGTPLYVRHHIVHNTTVIKDFENKGVTFIEQLNEVPPNSVVVFSAHGTPPDEYKLAKERDIKIIDATCPLVTKIHREAVRFSKKNVQTVLIGHNGHQEMIGTSGYVNADLLYIVENESDVEKLNLNPDQPIGFLTQTTLSVDDTKNIIKKLKERYPTISAPPKADICYATTNRQEAVKDLVKNCDIIIVCGSRESSNSNRLKETAKLKGVESYIIDTVDELDINWLKDKKSLGITSGASVPKKVVDNLLAKLTSVFPNVQIHYLNNAEHGIKFPIPNI
ncbi:4-hydroxy-3-methylbut-2-enyl diphosphate reductase [Candidatus Marinamargulisbacteria bacterium SCGC AG-410-N11]|nr:4-hydroxy-3-methylbut-2-enyl diphosphate reductase [Candidatus Marinamargulisbacteria bacterium SCGC AG-410-N11]